MEAKSVTEIIAIYIVAIGPNGAPNSHVWLAVDPKMEDLDRHQVVLSYLKENGIVHESGHFLTLTEKGRILHDRIKEVLVKE